MFNLVVLTSINVGIRVDGAIKQSFSNQGSLLQIKTHYDFRVWNLTLLVQGVGLVGDEKNNCY